ncbi:hypothetical protein MUP06_01380, partial [Patescibacteria group bacterium]|nr:hypothetical protein [Patescibacteria group bacterium]
MKKKRKKTRVSLAWISASLGIFCGFSAGLIISVLSGCLPGEILLSFIANTIGGILWKLWRNCFRRYWRYYRWFFKKYYKKYYLLVSRKFINISSPCQKRKKGRSKKPA